MGVGRSDISLSDLVGWTGATAVENCTMVGTETTAGKIGEAPKMMVEGKTISKVVAMHGLVVLRQDVIAMGAPKVTETVTVLDIVR